MLASCTASKIHHPGGKKKKRDCDCPAWSFVQWEKTEVYNG